MNDTIKELVKAFCGAVVGGISAVSAYHFTAWRLSSEQNLYLAPVLITSNNVCDIDQDKLVASWKSYNTPSAIEKAAYDYFASLPKDDANLKAQFKKSFPSRLRDHLQNSSVFSCHAETDDANEKSIEKGTTVEIGIGMREKADYLISRTCTLNIEGLNTKPIPLLIETGVVSQATMSPRPIQVVTISKTEPFVAVVSKAWGEMSLPVPSPAKASVTCKVLTPDGFREEKGEGHI